MERSPTWLAIHDLRDHDVDADPIAAFALDAPTGGASPAADTLDIDGWVLGRSVRPVAIEIADPSGVRWRIGLGRPRPDVAARYPGSPGAAESGFAARIPTSHLGHGAEVRLAAVLPDGRRHPFASIQFPAADPAAATQDPPPSTSAVWPADGALREVAGPDFVIIGTQRGGTTSLHRYLRQHPRIILPARKELHYFSRFYDRGAGWYREQFPARLPIGTLTGEATPYYLFHPLAPRRLRTDASAAKLIVLLRDPVDRAYSHYYHERRGGHELVPFEAAIAAEPERLRGEVERTIADERYDSVALRHHSYLARGRYAEQLRAWLAQVPRDRLLILESEALYRDATATARLVTDFLGLPPRNLRDRRAANDEPYPPMATETRAGLEAAFDGPNRELVELLGWTPSWATMSSP